MNGIYTYSQYVNLMYEIKDVIPNSIEFYLENLLNENKENKSFVKNLYKYSTYICHEFDKNNNYTHDLIFENGDFIIENNDIKIDTKLTNFHIVSMYIWYLEISKLYNIDINHISTYLKDLEINFKDIDIPLDDKILNLCKCELNDISNIKSIRGFINKIILSFSESSTDSKISCFNTIYNICENILKSYNVI